MTTTVSSLFGARPTGSTVTPQPPAPVLPRPDAVRDLWQPRATAASPAPIQTAIASVGQTVQSVANEIAAATRPLFNPASAPRPTPATPTASAPVCSVPSLSFPSASAPASIVPPASAPSAFVPSPSIPSVPSEPSRFSTEQAIAIAGRLHDAMYGDLFGTREKQIFDSLDGLTAEETRQVAYQYELKYNLEGGQGAGPQGFRTEGSLLYSRLQGELDESAGDWSRAQALLRGDSATADAVALRTEAAKGWPFQSDASMLEVLRQAPPAERLAIIDAFAKDYSQQTHLAYTGAGTRPIPADRTPEYSADPATLMMNVLKTRLSKSEFTEAVGLIAAAKYKDDPSVVASSQGQATVGRLYSLLDRPFPDGAGALDVLKGLSPEERSYLQGQAPVAGGPSKLEELMRSKLSAAELRQATAYLGGDPASAQATALYEALTRKVVGRGGAMPNPDVAAAERILRSVETDEQRQALLGALERQYGADVTSIIPRSVSATNRDVLVGLAETPPEVLAARAATLAGLSSAATQANLEFRADELRRSTQRLVGVDESAVRQAFEGLSPEQARRLANMPLDPSQPGGRTLNDELLQWYRGGGGGRFTLELRQMLDGDAAATGNLAEQIDEAQARYALETSGPGAAVNDAIQSAFGSDARALLDRDAARLQGAETALRLSPTAGASRDSASAALAYMDVAQADYNTAKDKTTEAAKTVATTVAVVGTTMATGGTAAAVWAPILAGASANVAANQLRGNANSWTDNVVAGLEGAANGVVLPGTAVAARGGQYVVREAVMEGGEIVFRSVPATLAREAATTAVTEGGQQVLVQGGQAMVRLGERYFAVETFQQTLGQAVRQNVAEAVIGSVAGDVAAGTVRGDLRPGQIAQNAVLAGVTGLAFTTAVHGAQAVFPAKRGSGADLSEGTRPEAPLPPTEAPRTTPPVLPAQPEGSVPVQSVMAPRLIETAPVTAPKTPLPTGVDRVVQQKLVDPVTRRPEFLALGFDPERPLELRRVLESTRDLITEETLSGDVFTGRLFTVKTDVVGPNGRRGTLAAFWELRDGEDVPTLVSAVLAKVDGRPTGAALATAPRIPPVPPVESGVTSPMQDAFVTAMRETGVVEMAVRPSSPDAPGLWHGIGGGTVRDASGNVHNAGPVFATKPSGAVTLTPEHVQTIDAARARAGLAPLHVAYPDLPIPRQVTLPDGTTTWAQQLVFGGVHPVVVNPVRDASGRIVDGQLVLSASDVDIVYARGSDGRLLTDDEISQGLVPAINGGYSQAHLKGVPYDIVHPGAHFNGIQDPVLRRKFDLDQPKYWNQSIHVFSTDGGGYQRTAHLGKTYRDLVDPSHEPSWLDLPFEAWESGQPLPAEVVRAMRADLAQPTLPPDPGRLARGKVRLEGDAAQVASLRRQERAGDLLAQGGYDVVHEPQVPGTRKRPDYLVDGKPFDCYSPEVTDPDKIWTAAKHKVAEGQAHRLVLMLEGKRGVDLAALKGVFERYPMRGLEELIVVTPEGGVAHFWP